MKKRTKIIMFVLVIILIGVTFFLISSMNKRIFTSAKENAKNQVDNTNIINTNSNNTIENENQLTNNNSAEENTLNVVENKIEEENIPENKPTAEESNVVNPEEKAIEIVKKHWGEDTNVYFSYDGVTTEGKHIVGVRNKSDTSIKYWYDVDVKTETFTVRK